MSESEKPSYRFGSFLLSTAEQRLTRDGAEVALTRKAFEVLLILVRNGGRVVEKQSLLQEVWPDTFVGENILAVNVRALRKALEEEKGRPKYIETVPRVGYRFAAEVITRGDETPGPIPVEPLPMRLPEAAGQAPARPAAGFLTVMGGYRLGAVLAGVAIVAAAIAGMLIIRGWPSMIRSIAVAPLVELGRQKRTPFRRSRRPLLPRELLRVSGR